MCCCFAYSCVVFNLIYNFMFKDIKKNKILIESLEGSFLELKTYLKNNKVCSKILNVSHNTSGNTQRNSPIKNRSMRNYSKVLSRKQELEMKRESINREYIRKSEASNIEQMDLIYDYLLTSVLLMNKFSFYNFDFKNIFKIDDFTRCVICNDYLDFDKFIYPNSCIDNFRIEAEHIHPKSEEVPRNIDGNIVWCHRQCNMIKGTSMNYELLDKIIKNKNRFEQTKKEIEIRCNEFEYDTNNRVIRKQNKNC